MEDEPIPVELVRDATSEATGGPAAERLPVAERTACLQEAQLTAFTPIRPRAGRA